MTISNPAAIVALLGLNIVVGAVLYLDVRRMRRSQGWLIAFWLLSLPAIVAYLMTRRQSVTTRDRR